MIPDNYVLPGALAILGAVVAYRVWQSRPGLRSAVVQAVAPAAQPAATGHLADAEADFLAAYDKLKRAGKAEGVRQLLGEMRAKEAAVVREELAGTFAPPAPKGPPPPAA